MSPSGLSSTGFIRTWARRRRPLPAPLRDTDLAPVGDPGVVRHVLGLERHDVNALAGEPARARPVARTLLPAIDVQPRTISGRRRAMVRSLRSPTGRRWSAVLLGSAPPIGSEVRCDSGAVPQL